MSSKIIRHQPPAPADESSINPSKSNLSRRRRRRKRRAAKRKKSQSQDEFCAADNEKRRQALQKEELKKTACTSLMIVRPRQWTQSTIPDHTTAAHSHSTPESIAPSGDASTESQVTYRTPSTTLRTTENDQCLQTIQFKPCLRNLNFSVPDSSTRISASTKLTLLDAFLEENDLDGDDSSSTADSDKQYTKHKSLHTRSESPFVPSFEQIKTPPDGLDEPVRRPCPGQLISKGKASLTHPVTPETSPSRRSSTPIEFHERTVETEHYGSPRNRSSPRARIPVATPERKAHVPSGTENEFTLDTIASPGTNEIFDAIDAVSNEVFNFTRTIDVTTQASLNEKLHSPREKVPQFPPQNALNFQNIIRDDGNAQVENNDIWLHDVSECRIFSGAVACPARQRKKRKVTGLTSKHFSPEKPGRPKKSEPLESQPAAVTGDNRPSPPETDQIQDNAQETIATDDKPARAKRKATGTKSDHFLPLDRVDLHIPGKPRAPAGVSIAPVPSINCATFGIIQEKLWREPFWLLIAVMLLNVTTGRIAIPTFWAVKQRWPTVQALSQAEEDDLCTMIRHCGLQHTRSSKMIRCAQIWLDDSPVKGRRHRILHYPKVEDGKEYKRDVIIETDSRDVAGALEIAHLPGCGRYAYDSWRIFCRDVCRQVADDYLGRGSSEEGFEPEWKRVLPEDKELRATLRWMWLREGFIWNCETGERRRATEEEMKDAVNGQMQVADADEQRFAAKALSRQAKPVVIEDNATVSNAIQDVIVLDD